MHSSTVTLSILLFGLSFVGCTTAAGGQPLESPCALPEDCASGLCTDAESTSGSYCTVECASDTDCVTEGRTLACDVATGTCYRPCYAGTTRGAGTNLEVCFAGRFFGCATRPAASWCSMCGCEPFGGGTCVEGMGCFVAQPDGSPCTADAECSSGACFRDTMVCGAPRATGEHCSVDAECSTLNCSTDGDQTTVGHCNQPLGSSCSAPRTGRNVTETCNNCQISFGDSSGYCLRDDCDPGDADHCASFAGHDFSCARGADSAYHCFEVCRDELDDCYYDTVFCYSAGDYCR